jgi:hypothetical protein
MEDPILDYREPLRNCSIENLEYVARDPEETGDKRAENLRGSMNEADEEAGTEMRTKGSWI